MLTLQWTAFNHAELECADAMSAFLQGDGHEMQDTECAMNMPLGSAVRLANAVNGLGNTPGSWWLFVDRFLTSIGGRRTRTDPIVWSFLGQKFEQPQNALR